MTLEERIKQMNLSQIQERLTQIQNEVNDENANLDDLAKETNLLIARKAELETQARNVQAQRTNLLNMIANGNVQTVPANNPSASEHDRGSMEYRTAFMNYVMRGQVSDVLQMVPQSRANEVGVASDLGVLLPETIVQKVMTKLSGVYGQLYTKVNKTNIRGGVKYPIGEFAVSFRRIVETQVSDRQKTGKVTDYVQFGYNMGEIRVAQTLLQSILTVEDFENKISEEIVKCYIEAMDKEILNGKESDGQCEGILTEAAKEDSRIDASHIIEMTAEDVADWTAWEKKLFAVIPIAMEKYQPEFVCAKQTYVSNLCTLKDANGQPIKKAGFDASDKMHKFNEYEVNRVEKDIFKDFDSCTAGEYFGMFWVPKEAYAINSNLEFSLIRYFDNETNQYVTKAIVINDGKVLNPDFIYLLKKK